MTLFDLTATLFCSSIKNLLEKWWLFVIHIITLLFKVVIDLLQLVVVVSGCKYLTFKCQVRGHEWHFS